MKTKDLNNIINFWTRVMKDPSVPIMARLKASELLVYALGGFTTKIEIINKEV